MAADFETPRPSHKAQTALPPRKGRGKGRGLVPAILVLAGILGLIYGAVFHSEPVIVTKAPPVAEAPPQPVPEAPTQPAQPLVPSDAPPEFALWPDLAQPAPASPATPEITTPAPQTFAAAAAPATEVIALAEPAIVYDVTIGGLVLSPGGIKRTYLPGQPASACPT